MADRLCLREAVSNIGVAAAEDINPASPVPLLAVSLPDIVIAYSPGARERHLWGEPIRMTFRINIPIARIMIMGHYMKQGTFALQCRSCRRIGLRIGLIFHGGALPLFIIGIQSRASTVVSKRRNKQLMEREPFFLLRACGRGVTTSSSTAWRLRPPFRLSLRFSIALRAWGSGHSGGASDFVVDDRVRLV